MARTRQKRKAKQRREQQQQQASRRDATAKQQPTNPAEQAVIQHADALEAGDELEEIARGEQPQAEAPEVEAPEEETPDQETPEVETPEDASGVDGPAAPEAPAPVKRRDRRPAPADGKAAKQEKEKRRERRPAPSDKRKEPRQRGRIVNFLIQVWAELRRVQWPDRNQVTQATGVVVVFCFIAGAFLAFWDFVFGKLVTSLL